MHSCCPALLVSDTEPSKSRLHVACLSPMSHVQCVPWVLCYGTATSPGTQFTRDSQLPAALQAHLARGQCIYIKDRKVALCSGCLDAAAIDGTPWSVQVTDVNTTENNSFLQYHKYPSLEGTERDTWKEGVNRITAHTDEALMTLLFNSPGAHPPLAPQPSHQDGVACAAKCQTPP